MGLSETLFQIMRHGRNYSPLWIAKRNKLSVSSVQVALTALVRGNVIIATRAKGDRRRRLYRTKQPSLQMTHSSMEK